MPKTDIYVKEILKNSSEDLCRGTEQEMFEEDDTMFACRRTVKSRVLQPLRDQQDLGALTFENSHPENLVGLLRGYRMHI